MGCLGLWRSENWRGENSPRWEGGKKVIKLCEVCGKEFEVFPSHTARRFCSRPCKELWQSGNMRGENNPNWKGGGEKKNCEWCGLEFETLHTRTDTARFCSLKCVGLWYSENWGGENSPHWKGGEIKAICEICGKEYGVKPAHADKRKHCSLECVSGKNSRFWKGGTSFEPYGLEWTDKLKRAIRKRDNHTCAISGKPGRCVHHINYCKTDNRPENLITLSASCHSKTNHNRDLWQALLGPVAQLREVG